MELMERTGKHKSLKLNVAWKLGVCDVCDSDRK